MTVMFLLELNHAPGVCVYFFALSASSLWVKTTFMFTLK